MLAYKTFFHKVLITKKQDEKWRWLCTSQSCRNEFTFLIEKPSLQSRYKGCVIKRLQNLFSNVSGFGSTRKEYRSVTEVLCLKQKPCGVQMTHVP